MMVEKSFADAAQYVPWSGWPKADCNNASSRFFITEGRIPLGLGRCCAWRLNLPSWYRVANRASPKPMEAPVISVNINFPWYYLVDCAVGGIELANILEKSTF